MEEIVEGDKREGKVDGRGRGKRWRHQDELRQYVAAYTDTDCDNSQQHTRLFDTPFPLSHSLKLSVYPLLDERAILPPSNYS